MFPFTNHGQEEVGVSMKFCVDGIAVGRGGKPLDSLWWRSVCVVFGLLFNHFCLRVC